MQFTDLPSTPLSASLSNKANEAFDILKEGFLKYLEEKNIIVRSSIDNTLKDWLKNTSYNNYFSLFRNYWQQTYNLKIEKIIVLAVQLVSILSFQKPPSKDIILRLISIRVAEILLSNYLID